MFYSHLIAEGDTVGGKVVTRVRYEDIIADPTRVLADLFAFVEAPASSEVHEYIRRNPVYDRRTKWRGTLLSEQQRVVERILSDDLSKSTFHDE